MTEFSTGENPVEARIMAASKDQRVKDIVHYLFFSDARIPGYDPDDVVEEVRDEYNLSEEQFGYALGLCEHDMLTGIIGIPVQDEFSRMIEENFSDAERQNISVEFTKEAVALAAGDERIRNLAGDIAYMRLNKLENLDEIRATLNEVGRERGLTYLQISRVLEDVLAEFDEEIASETRAGQFNDDTEDATLAGEIDE